MAGKWFDDPKSFEHMRTNFTTAFRVNGGANMSLPLMSEMLCEMREEIERLRKLSAEYGRLEAAIIMADREFDGDSDHPDCITRLLASVQRLSTSKDYSDV